MDPNELVRSYYLTFHRRFGFIHADAPTANLRVSDIMESLLVHPALAEALAEAAE